MSFVFSLFDSISFEIFSRKICSDFFNNFGMISDAFTAKLDERVLVSANIKLCPPFLIESTPKTIDGKPGIVESTSKVLESFSVTTPPSYTPSESGTGLQLFSTNLQSNQSAISSLFEIVALRPTICGLFPESLNFVNIISKVGPRDSSPIK